MATIQLPSVPFESPAPAPLALSAAVPPEPVGDERTQAQPVRAAVAWIVLVGACLICLGPFVGKAFHIDDPLFVWTARQIRANPVDFFGFTVNWYTTETPMSQVTMNPPLTSYYLALATALFGEREVPLHMAFLIWPALLAVGTYYLAQRFCGAPLVAALATLLAPVVLVSSTSVMSDVMMLALWVWALVCWDRGLARDSLVLLLLGGVLAGLAFLTKYFAVALLPLLLAYAIAQRKPARQWALPLLVPVLVIASYQYLTFRLYGRALLFGAAAYATTHRSTNMLTNFVVGLSFTGGCIGSVVFFAPFLWRRRDLLIGAGVSLMLALLALRSQPDAIHMPLWSKVLQIALFIGGGLCLGALAIVDYWQRRDPVTLLLLCWVLGTFVFAFLLNWTMNARSILPLAPAAGILLVRRLQERFGSLAPRRALVALPLALTAFVGLAVTMADYSMAGAGRTAARELQQKYARGHGPIWFQGHWGFQYYMQRLGCQAIDFDLMAGYEAPSVLLLPVNSTYVLTLNPNQPYGLHSSSIEKMFKLNFDAFPWLATMHPAVNAGFYSCSMKQSLPYSFCAAPTEDYWVVLVREARRSPNRTQAQAITKTSPTDRDRLR